MNPLTFDDTTEPPKQELWQEDASLTKLWGNIIQKAKARDTGVIL